MNTDGAMGEAPDWYLRLRAARFLGVSPWDLGEQPVFWLNAALVAEDVETRFQNERQERERS